MRTLSVVLFTLILAAGAATVALADTVCVPAPAQPTAAVSTCPPVATCPPAPCPTVCPEPCPPPPLACPPTIAGCGAGPVNELAGLTPGPAFDQKYVQVAFQTHSEVISLANVGAQRATDPNLMKFSEKIVNERTDMNNKLSEWYPQIGGCGALTFNTATTASAISCICGLCGPDFDRSYVANLIEAMQKESRVANDGINNLTVSGLKDQANLVKRTDYNEIMALQNWQNTGVLKK